MAKDVADNISYYLVIEAVHESDLANIRQWNNLKIALNENQIWIKDFDYAQIHSLEVKSIPYKTIFYALQGKLFLLNSRLPDRNIPSLLWTSIDRALPVKLPAFNHNYFGIEEKISVSIIPSETEVESIAMISTVETLHKYIETVPSIRLQNIKWAILNNDKVFLLGTPLLPIKGNVFWQRGDFFLPAGYDLDLFLLTEPLSNLLNPEKNNLVVWNTDSTYFLLEKEDLQVLSLASFRSSVGQFLSATIKR